VHLLLAGWLLLGSLVAQQVAPRQLHLGFSAEGRPIDGYWLGDGPIPVLVVGGLHGRPEGNSSDLVWQLLNRFVQIGLPSRRVSLLLLPDANPDGLADNRRELADGVDPNRNFPTSDWTVSTYAAGRELPDGGGRGPLSEPETVTLAGAIARFRPAAVVSYHAAGGFVMGGPAAQRSGLLDVFADATAYPIEPFLAYPVTGDFAQWCDELGIPTIEVELIDHAHPELDRNFAGVTAVLGALGSRLAAIDPSY
jgi:murein peptide amidase A